LSDGPNQLRLDSVRDILLKAIEIDKIIKEE